MFFTELIFNPRGKSQRNTLLKIEMSETTFVKYDPTQKNDQNMRTKTLQDCDEQYLRRICNQEGLFPIWLTNDFEKVTKQKIITKSGEV